MFRYSMVYEIRKSFLFFLDTRYRSGGTLSRPVFTFPNNLIAIEDEKIRLTLNEMSMEYTFYQTELYNNKFLLIENGVNRIIEIEIGNYNLVTFLTELTIELCHQLYSKYKQIEIHRYTKTCSSSNVNCF